MSPTATALKQNRSYRSRVKLPHQYNSAVRKGLSWSPQAETHFRSGVQKNTGTACTAKLSVVEKSKKSQPTHSPKKTRSESRGAATTWLPAELTFTSFLLQEPQLHTHPWVPGDSYHTAESTGSSLSALWGWSAHIHQSKQQQQQTEPFHPVS